MALRAARPSDIGALRALLANSNGPLCYIAGGTDLLVAPRAPPDDGWLIDISRTSGLAFIAADEARLRIGATTTIDALARDPSNSTTLRRARPGGRTVRLRANPQSRHDRRQCRRRLAGGRSVARAAMRGCALRGSGPRRRRAPARLRRARRRRRTDTLAPGDLIAEIEIPLAGRLSRSAFVKLGRRDDLTVSRLNLTMEADFNSASLRFGEARLVAGAIAPTPLRLESVAQTLRGQALCGPVVRAFTRALVSAVDAAIPGRGSQPYKRRAVMGLGFDLLERITAIPGLDAIEGSLA